MNRDNFLIFALLLGAGGYLYFDAQSKRQPPPPAQPYIRPIVPVRPIPVPVSPWGPRPCPSFDYEAGGKPQLGALVSPDATVEVVADLPLSEKKKNVGGRDGAGLCVFTSVEWAARFQNEPLLINFQQQMRKELGGGYPQKVDKMIAKYAPGSQYVQHTGGDMSFLKLALKTGRMPGVTYGGYDPHYRGYVAHMVNLVYLDDQWAAISDNNFVGDDQIVWMSPAEFERRWKLGGGGWAIVLLSPPPPPKLKVR